MKRSEVFQSKWLHCEDLHGKPIVVTINEAVFELLKSPDGKEEHKTVLHFNGAKKCLPLNRTNWDSVAEICGADTDDWAGGKIELYPSKTEIGGKPKDCIRIRPPSQKNMLLKQPAKQQLQAAVTEAEVATDVEDGTEGGFGDTDPDDEIPF